MKIYINLFVWWGMFYILVEVIIGHLEPLWLLPGMIAIIINTFYFNYNKKEDEPIQ